MLGFYKMSCSKNKSKNRKVKNTGFQFKKKNCATIGLVRVNLSGNKNKKKTGTTILSRPQDFYLMGPKTNGKKYQVSPFVSYKIQGQGKSRLILFTFRSFDNKIKTVLGMGRKNKKWVCDKACWKPGAPNSCSYIEKNYNAFIYCKKSQKKICGQMQGSSQPCSQPCGAGLPFDNKPPCDVVVPCQPALPLDFGSLF